MQNNKSVVLNPYSCMVGCGTCGTGCPIQAITFPERDLIWKLERERKIFSTIRKEFGEKKATFDFLNVNLNTPMVKGAMENSPSYMSFEMTSTEQADIQEFLTEVRVLIRCNGLDLASENKL